MSNMSELLSAARKENEELKAQLSDRDKRIHVLEQRIMDMHLHGAVEKQPAEVQDGSGR